MTAVTRYDRDDVKFDQTKCEICWDDFSKDQQITKLACNHIYHVGCLIDSIIKCPKCQVPIEGRTRSYSRQEIEDEVNALVTEIASLSPLTAAFQQNLTFQFIKRSIIDAQVQRFAEGVMGYDGVVRMREIREGLQIIRGGDADRMQNLVGIVTFQVIDSMINELRNTPIDLIKSMTGKELKEFVAKTIPKILPFLKAFGVADERVENFVTAVCKRVKQDRRFQEFVQSRDKEYVELAKEHLKSKGCFGRFKFISKISDVKKRVLSHLPGVQTAIKAKKLLDNAIITVLGGTAVAVMGYVANEVFKQTLMCQDFSPLSQEDTLETVRRFVVDLTS